MKHIEYEERVIISKSDYLKIIEDFSNHSQEKLFIENIYLDNREQFIYKTKKMLRIRNTNHKKQELTLKIGQPDGSNLEINETLDKHPLIDQKLNNQFGCYKEVLRLVTHRIEIQMDDYLLVIDKNEYNNITDYNIEIEAKSQQKAQEIIKNYCKKYNLIYKENCPTKSQRAFDSYYKK